MIDRPGIKACFVAAALASASLAYAQEPIKGAGATFPSAVYTGWAFSFAKENKTPVNYAATGSGDGIKQIVARTVDFGGSDVPMSNEDLQKNGLIQFPTLVGGVVPVYNVPGVKANELKLSAQALAHIFSGQVAQWNDKEIAALNPGLKLPSLPIGLVVRSDESGTTSTFTQYLSRVSTWKLGSGLSVRWPAGAHAVKGNDAVGNAVKERAGSIGYVSSNTVKRLGLAGAMLYNKSGKFVAATESALLSAVSFSQLGKSGSDSVSLLDMAGAESWPITDATYILVDRSPKSAAKARQVLKFFYWVFLQGDAMATDTGFVPLPVNVQARVVSAFRQVTDSGGNPIDFMSGNPPAIAAASSTRP